MNPTEFYRPNRHDAMRHHLLSQKCGCRPAANIIEGEKAIEIKLAIPGIDKKDISINIEKQMLTVRYEKKEKKEKTEERVTHREFFQDDFSRSVILSQKVNIDSISAEYQDGILTLEIPYKEEVILKKNITIQ
jgi:HSP20 family protein